MRDDLKEMTASRAMLAKEKETFATSMKDKVNLLEKELKECKLELDKWNDEFNRVEKQNKQLLMEREKMKQRFIRLKNRRFKMDQNQKICKKCAKEYNEKENYNWSCRTHQSEWGGEMWWCCGKSDKENPGCKFSKHECKEDDEDEGDAEEKLQDQLKLLKNVRCYCCKEIGHNMELCPRDPNIKTNGVDLEDEFERIQRIKDYRTLFSDTMVMTTHFLKRCIKIPKVKDELNELSLEQRILKNAPFKRGAMKFEDYNYNMYNQYILVDNQKGGKHGIGAMKQFTSFDGGPKLTEQQLE